MTIILNPTPVRITRRGPVTYVAGLPSRPAPSTFVISASVQPMSGDDLRRLALGERARRARKLYTLLPQNMRLRTVLVDGPEADLATIDGVAFEVYHVESYAPGSPIAHQRVYLTAAEGTDGPPTGPGVET